MNMIGMILLAVVVGSAAFILRVILHSRNEHPLKIEVPLPAAPVRFVSVPRPMTPAELRQRAKLTVTREERDARARAKWREVSRRLNDVVSSGALPGSYIDSMTEQLQRTMAAALRVAESQNDQKRAHAA